MSAKRPGKVASIRRRVLRRRPKTTLCALATILTVVVASMVIPSYATPPIATAASDSDKSVTLTQPLDEWTIDNPPATFPNASTQAGITAIQSLVSQEHEVTPKPMASVTVSLTQNLHQRQQIQINWQGFKPTQPPLAAPTPFAGDTSQDPVVIIECWGKDTPQTPMDPTHCQGPPFDDGGHQMRDGGAGSFKDDVYQMTNDSDNGPVRNGKNPTDVSSSQPGVPALKDTLGFTGVDGQHYTGAQSGSTFDMPSAFVPEPTAPLPDNTLAMPTGSAFTPQNGPVQFEVRGGSDDAPLGCAPQPLPGTQTSDCTLEVIPIVRQFCDPLHYTAPPGFNPITDINNEVKWCVGKEIQTGTFNRPASNLFSQEDTWWLAGQWKNRFAFPLQFAQESGFCPVVDHRPTLTLQGSEAAENVLGSWGQQFCLDPRNTFKITQQLSPEDAGREAMNSGSVPAALTTFPDTDSPRPVVHAPIAATGWTVSFLLDVTPDGTGQPRQVTDITLSPLLLAKLTTDSYTYSLGDFQAFDPAVTGNAESLLRDPEFLQLNPDFPTKSAATDGVTWQSQDSDVFAAMFAYIDADPAAHAFMEGQPDPFTGMVVNPKYRGVLTPPQFEFQQLDNFQDPNPTNGAWNPCLPTVQPLYNREIGLEPTLDQAARDVQSRHPQTLGCNHPDLPADELAGTGTWGPSKVFQAINQRNVFALTTVPFAEQYGLSMANLVADDVQGSQPVAPSGEESDLDTIQNALGFTQQDPATGVTSVDPSILPPNGAYGGMFPIYVAAPTCGLDPTTAGEVADFLQFAATTGQQPGQLAGNLPPGYAPLPAAYTKVTQDDAAAVRNQAPICPGDAPAPPGDLASAVRDELGLPSPDSSFDFSGATTTIDAGSGNGGPGAATTSQAGKPGAAPKKLDLAATKGIFSWLAQWGLPLLLALGGLTGLSRRGVHALARPGHPLRRGLAWIRRHVKALSGRVRSTVRAGVP